MSKRKNGEGRGEDVVGVASKKMKTAHPGSADIPEHYGGQQPVQAAEEMIVSRNRELRIARRKARKEHRKARRDQEVEAAGEKDHKQESRQNSSGKKTKKHTRRKESGWQISDAVGGYLADLDPVFSVDEKHLLLAYESSICIYATNTSLLVRTLLMSAKQSRITGFTLSPSNPSLLYVALRQGLVEKWNWRAGQRLGKWIIGSQISGITAISQISHNVEEDLVYTADGRAGSWMITAHYLRLRESAHQTEAHTLYKSTEPISSVKVLGSGSVVTASAGSRLILGNITSPQNAALKNVKYTWREITCPEWITAIDAHIRGGQKEVDSGGTIKASPASSNSIDIVIGGLKGSVYVYRNLLANLIQKERKKQIPTPVSQHLHWHRTGVGAVKWSADGNYIISGGGETVLVLWQLDTGQQQLLPHLSAPIESVVVSPSGISYAVRLADNSAMVLSTTELQPTVSISGVQVAASRSSMIQVPDVPRVVEPSNGFFMFRRPAAAVSGSSAGQILLAVPGSSQSRVGVSGTTNAAYLQTLQIRSGSQVSRQALTRTKVTDKSIGPESNTIEEPNVVLIQTSHNGQWLATAEEWTPPRQDVLFLATDIQDTIEKQFLHMEIYLKFWQWDDMSKQWELVSRIEAPHRGSDRSSRAIGRIIDLVEDPSSSGFATIGDDGIVKIWRPKIRYRDGIKVKSREGHSLNTWSCRHSIPLAASDEIEEAGSSQITARLALSLDGSLLAVGYQSLSSSSLYLIDTESGDIRNARTDIFSERLIGVGIIDRYLIALTQHLLVWDIVDDRIQYEIAIRSYGLSSRTQLGATHLAVNQQSKNFAVTVPEVAKSGSETKLGSQVAVFDPANSNPINITILPQTLLAMLPWEQNHGYVTIDWAARVRTLAPNLQLPSTSTGTNEQSTVLNGLKDIYGTSIRNLLDKTKNNGRNALLLKGPSESADDSMVDIEDDVILVRRHELAEIFDSGSPLALPSIATLMEQVAGLFSKRLST
ncbi:hypothetical protein MMC11_007847 [Xylographa trunciseda]|nr:hypothetical protein [Xylographa trunciseda]